MQYNISPETLVQPEDYDDDMRKIISDGVTVDKMLNKEIDLECLNGKNVVLSPSGHFFRTDIKGFLPEILETKYNERKAIKNEMLQKERDHENGLVGDEVLNVIGQLDNTQWSKKISLNSAYGNLGTEFSRYYDVRLAGSVTAGARLSLLWIKNKINEWLNKKTNQENKDFIIAGDTDSVYIKMEEFVDMCYGENKPSIQEVTDFLSLVASNYIEKIIDKGYQELADYVHAPQQKMKMKREVIAERAVWTAKKRYAMTVYNGEANVTFDTPHYKYVGLEIIKSSTPKLVREYLKRAVEIVLTGTESELIDYVKTVKTDFYNQKPEDISFPKGVNGINKYSTKSGYKKGTPINARASILYNSTLDRLNLDKTYQKINDGDKIRFIYLEKPNPIKEDVIAFPKYLPKEFGLHDYIDYDTQFEKVFLQPLKNILDVIGWNYKKEVELF